MSKLFAFENADVIGDEVELETPVEVGEVADVEVDVMEEGGEIEEQAEAIEEGVEAGDQMEQVEELVEQAAEEGEGLDPVAAEAIRIAVEAICARVGANPKSMYALYATENFQSASSRKANTRFALEGVKEFLQDLWKKIKAALSNLWSKVKAFWEKHVSSLGQVKKALESMKKKVSASSGKFEGQGFVEKAPGFILSSFPVQDGDVTKEDITKVIAAHGKAEASKEVAVVAAAATTEVGKGAKKAGKATEVATENADVNAQLAKYTGAKTYGSKEAPLVGGIHIVWDLKVDDEGVVSVEVTENKAEDVAKEAGVLLMAKNDLSSALSSVTAIIDANIKQKGEMDKVQKAFETEMDTIKTAINASVTSSESSKAAKELRKSVKNIYALQTKTIQFTNKCTALDVRLAKAVLGYAGLCVKNYK